MSKITYLNPETRIAAIRAAVTRAAGRLPQVKRCRLFGSLADGTATPRSDADLFIEVAHSEHEQPRDRIPEMLAALSPLPCPVDVFIFTSDEVKTLTHQQSPLLREVNRAGIDLL